MSTSETQDQKDREHKDEHEPDSDGAPSSGRDPLGPILESFLARFRKGERPSLTEYIGRYPELADEIRELFPALVEIEQLGSLGGAAAQAGASRAGSVDPRPAQGATSATAAYDPAAGPAAAGGERAWPMARAAGRLPHPRLHRRGGHGRGLRGGAGIAPQPRGAQGHAPTVPRQRRLPPAVP